MASGAAVAAAGLGIAVVAVGFVEEAVSTVAAADSNQPEGCDAGVAPPGCVHGHAAAAVTFLTASVAEVAVAAVAGDDEVR